MRITGLPAPYSGGAKLITGYYTNNLTRTQTQNEVTNTYELDPALRQHERVRVGGAEEGTEIYHYAGSSDSPAWIEDQSGAKTTWTRSIAAMGGGLGALETNTGEVTLQLANMHGDVVATAADDPGATKLLSTQSFDEFGNPEQSKALPGGSAEYGWLGSKGRRTQLSSGVIQMGMRSYVPALGRFLTPDPVRGGSANEYDYVEQDPVNSFDLEGTCGHRGEKHNCHPLHHHHGGHTTSRRPRPLITDYTITVAGTGITNTGGYIGATFTYTARKSVSVSAYFTFRDKTSEPATARGPSGTALINPVAYSGSVSTGEILTVCVVAVGEHQSERKCYQHPISVTNSSL